MEKKYEYECINDVDAEVKYEPMIETKRKHSLKVGDNVEVAFLDWMLIERIVETENNGTVIIALDPDNHKVAFHPENVLRVIHKASDEGTQ